MKCSPLKLLRKCDKVRQYHMLQQLVVILFHYISPTPASWIFIFFHHYHLSFVKKNSTQLRYINLYVQIQSLLRYFHSAMNKITDFITHVKIYRNDLSIKTMIFGIGNEINWNEWGSYIGFWIMVRVLKVKHPSTMKPVWSTRRKSWPKPDCRSSLGAWSFVAASFSNIPDLRLLFHVLRLSLSGSCLTIRRRIYSLSLFKIQTIIGNAAPILLTCFVKYKKRRLKIDIEKVLVTKWIRLLEIERLLEHLTKNF